MKKILALIVMVVVAILTPTPAESSPSLHRGGCVTKAEYSKVTEWETHRNKVHRVFGTKGKRYYMFRWPNRGYGKALSEFRSYRRCGGGTYKLEFFAHASDGRWILANKTGIY